MPLGLDHIVHAVRDLDAAVAFYRACGFQVSSRNKHPWGTHNHVVQFPGFFIEVLTVGEPDKLRGEGLATVFGVANQEAIARGDGFSMLALESCDIAADVADFKTRNIGTSDALPFTRQATLPDGATITVGFTLAFARDELSPHADFFAIQHRDPAMFYKAELQQHANGATTVLGAVLVADRPADHQKFIADVTGVRELHSDSRGRVAQTPRGNIEILNAVLFHEQFGVVPKIERTGMTFEGLRLAAPDLDAVARILAVNGIASHLHDGCLVIAPETAFGATLIFKTSR